MKAKFIAAVLSLFVINLSVHATTLKKSITQKQTHVMTHKIDLNKADVAMLTGSIRGIGKKRAEAIIAYRENHHGFKSLQELAEVKGLGQHFVTVNNDKLNEVFTITKIE